MTWAVMRPQYDQNTKDLVAILSNLSILSVQTQGNHNIVWIEKVQVAHCSFS